MDFYATLGGKQRRLLFRFEDLEWVEQQFPAPATGLPVSVAYILTSGAIVPIITVLFATMRHDQSVTLEQCRSWVADDLASGRFVKEVLEPMKAAIYASGMLGFVKEPPPIEDETGKALAAIRAAE